MFRSLGNDLEFLKMTYFTVENDLLRCWWFPRPFPVACWPWIDIWRVCVYIYIYIWDKNYLWLQMSIGLQTSFSINITKLMWNQYIFLLFLAVYSLFYCDKLFPYLLAVPLPPVLLWLLFLPCEKQPVVVYSSAVIVFIPVKISYDY